MSDQEETHVVNVHVVNATDLLPKEKPVSTRHTVTRTFTDIGIIVDLLEQDPRRIKTQFFISGVGTVFICHSYSQAQAAITGVGGNFGAAITCPGANVGSIRWEDTSQAHIWGVLTGASPVVSMISERKD